MYVSFEVQLVSYYVIFVTLARFSSTGIYLTCTMAITTLSMVLTVLVLNLHAISERPVPRWIRVLVIHYLGRLFCKWETPAPAETCKPVTGHVRKKRRGQYTVSMTGDDTEEVPIISHNGSATVNTAPTNGIETHQGPYGLPRGHQEKLLCRRRSLLRTEPPAKPDYSKEWQVVAEVVDRLFFWSFLLAIVAITLLLFHPLTKKFFSQEINNT